MKCESQCLSYQASCSCRLQVAFTLIELLTVIAILSLLGALLLSSVASAKHTAYAVLCSHNARQLAVEYITHLADNRNDRLYDESISMWCVNSVGAFSNKLWLCPETRMSTQSLKDFTLSSGSAISLTGGEVGTISKSWVSTLWITKRLGFSWDIPRAKITLNEGDLRKGSYTVNSWLLDDPPENMPYPSSRSSKNFFRTQSSIERPSATPLLGDGRTPFYAVEKSAAPTGNSFIVPRHGAGRMKDNDDPNKWNHILSKWSNMTSLPGAVNMAFVDGHVSAVRLSELGHLSWYKEYY